MLVRASISGDWLPNTCLKIEKVERRLRDVDRLYEKLGVEPTATQGEIRSAAKRLMMENHPDLGGDEDSFIEIREAYETLSDPASRLKYDNKEAGLTIRVRRVDKATAPQTQPAFYKEAKEMLSSEDISLVRRWMELLVETAYEFGAALEIKAGIVGKIPSGYEGDIALIAKDEVPQRWKAKLLILKEMVKLK